MRGAALDRRRRRDRVFDLLERVGEAQRIARELRAANTIATNLRSVDESRAGRLVYSGWVIASDAQLSRPDFI